MEESGKRPSSLARNYTDDVNFRPKTRRAPIPTTWRKFSRAVVAAGARTVNPARHGCYSVPEEYGELIGRMRGPWVTARSSAVHCHDDLGPRSREISNHRRCTGPVRRPNPNAPYNGIGEGRGMPR